MSQEVFHQTMIGEHPIVVGIDFDGTLTDRDVVDGLIERFSITDEYLQLEKEWSEGRLGSAECMARQLSGVRLDQATLNQYLSEIRLDPDLLSFKQVLLEYNIPLVVMSDGFDLLIEGVFRHHQVPLLPYRSNHMRIEGDRIHVDYPHRTEACACCAHCKHQTMQNYTHSDRRYIFIGDGSSDICATRSASLVFAKNRLANYCREKNKCYIPYDHLKDVIAAWPEVMHVFPNCLEEPVS
jgi:2-hydroxy-3-keto-5-methylthiopentenyl-1-phosphate phosphatase